MADFIEAEEVIRQFFKKGISFSYKGEYYTVIDSGKPLPKKGNGEPKTDIYVLAESNTGKREFKLSYKKENAEFLENKMKSDRAEQIFGPDWKEIIEENTKRISNKFEETPVFFMEQRKRTKPGSMTLGWRFELFNTPQGGLSGKMENMTSDQVYEVYAGEKLEDRKLNAKVNGKEIKNSGAAEFILVTDKVSSAQDIIDRMQRIRDYVEEHPDIYFGCKALNYQTKENTMEGNRALSVQVDWHVENDKLGIDIEYEKPLLRNGKQMKSMVEACLKAMKKKDATEVVEAELDDVPIYKKLVEE